MHDARRERPALLEVEDLRVAYGSAEVVRGVSFEVRAGEFVALLGRNGAGKSTLLHAVSGLIAKRGGRVRFGGQDVTGASPRQIVRSGLIQVLEGHRVFTTLTVEDNLLIGSTAATGRAERSKLERAYRLFPELAERRHQPAARLSGGQQQILAVAQGIIGEPKLLVLDEPSAGLAPLVIERILDVATTLCREGTAVLLVEQLVDKALRHAHHAYLLETGSIGGSGPPDEIRGSDALRRVYLGDRAAIDGGRR